jgi:4-carboxymuconolactone decarboxylase
VSEPRIPPRLAADFDAEVLDALAVLSPPGAPPPTPEQLERIRGRRVSNIVGIFAWHPALTKGFMTFNDHLFRSTLSARVRELVTVRVCWLRQGEYEWAQHVAMARTAGLSDEEIDAICEGPDATTWGPLDAALLRSVDEMVADRRISDQTWQQLAEHLDRRQLMDVVFTVGAYDLLCMAFDTFGIELDPGLVGFPAALEAPKPPKAPKEREERSDAVS